MSRPLTVTVMGKLLLRVFVGSAFLVSLAAVFTLIAHDMVGHALVWVFIAVVLYREYGEI